MALRVTSPAKGRKMPTFALLTLALMAFALAWPARRARPAKAKAAAPSGARP